MASVRQAPSTWKNMRRRLRSPDAVSIRSRPCQLRRLPLSDTANETPELGRNGARQEPLDGLMRGRRNFQRSGRFSGRNRTQWPLEARRKARVLHAPPRRNARISASRTPALSECLPSLRKQLTQGIWLRKVIKNHLFAPRPVDFDHYRDPEKALKTRRFIKISACGTSLRTTALQGLPGTNTRRFSSNLSDICPWVLRHR